jgi:hypothetical protein
MQKLWIFHCLSVTVVMNHEVIVGFDAVFFDCAVK